MTSHGRPIDGPVSRLVEVKQVSSAFIIFGRMRMVTIIKI